MPQMDFPLRGTVAIVIILLFSCDLEEIPNEIPITFERNYNLVGGTFRSVGQQTHDGGYIIASSGSNAGSIYIIKIDSLGVVEFYEPIESSLEAYVSAIQQTQDEGYILTGSAQIASGNSDVYLVKLRPDLSVEFENNFGGAKNEWGRSVQQTKDGGYIVVGSTCSYGVGCDVYLIKTNSMLGKEFSNFIGGNGTESGESVQQTNDEGYVVTGYSVVDKNGILDWDLYLIKTNKVGDSTKTGRFGDQLIEESGYSVQQTSDLGYILAGRAENIQSGNDNVYLVKIRQDFSIEYEKNYGGPDTSRGWSVRQTEDGGYIVAGNIMSVGLEQNDVYLIKTDPFLAEMFTRKYGGASNDVGYSVQQTRDGGYIVTGTTMSYNSLWPEPYLIKTDKNGLVH